MALRLLSLVFILLSAAAQPSLPDPVAGFVEKIDGRSFTLRSAGVSHAFSAHEKLEVWKGSRTFSDLASLRVGDEVRVTWRRPEGSSARLAIGISTVTSASGVIQHMTADTLEIRSTATNETRIAMITPDTTYGSAKGRVVVGHEVHVAGWDLGGGRIEARRIAAYNQDTPLDTLR